MNFNDLVTMLGNMGTPFGYPAVLPMGNQVSGAVPYGMTDSTAVTGQFSLNQQAVSLQELSALHNTYLVQGQLISTGTGADTSAPLPTTIVKKPWLDAPDGTVPFDPQTAVPLGVVGATVVAVELIVPDGYDGVINEYSWNFTGGGFVQGDGSLKAQVLRNGAAIRNYDNILVEKGTIAHARHIAPIRIWSGDRIQVTVNHVSNVLLDGQVVASLVGWFYPSAS